LGVVLDPLDSWSLDGRRPACPCSGQGKTNQVPNGRERQFARRKARRSGAEAGRSDRELQHDVAVYDERMPAQSRSRCGGQGELALKQWVSGIGDRYLFRLIAHRANAGINLCARIIRLCSTIASSSG